MIVGVELFNLGSIKDDRGGVFHFLKKSHPHFKDFGEIYFSQVNEAVTKGWKLHTRVQQHLAGPIGKTIFTLIDLRKSSKTYLNRQEVELSNNHYKLLTIPAGVAYKFKAAQGKSLIANYIYQEHDSNECINIPLDCSNFEDFSI